ncbi:MAG: Acg family FMN-binding oxidoreductase [Hyphomicrobiaceae bacterium]
MLSRRTLLIGTGAVVIGAGTAYGMWPGDDLHYQEILDETRKPVESWHQDKRALSVQLVRHATLAANSHNTQPWLFEAGGNTIRIRVDADRRCPVVDPDDRHVIASLGCATENLVLAAKAAGIDTQVEFEPSSRHVIVTMTTGRADSSAAYKAIVTRQTTRAPFDPTPLTNNDLSELENATQKSGVLTRFLTARKELDLLKEFVVEGNTAQCNDEAFVRELGDWIRFNQTHVSETRDGLYTGSTGNPNFPRWLGRHAFPLLFTAGSENPKYVAQLNGSAGAVVLYAENDKPEGWFNVGRASQRFQLEATARDVRTSFINQPVEVAAVRNAFRQWLGDGLRPALVIRYGRGKPLPHSLRRPVATVLKFA